MKASLRTTPFKSPEAFGKPERSERLKSFTFNSESKDLLISTTSFFPISSSKMKALFNTFDKIPRSEKALVTSFYKGGLDLLERMFVDLYPEMEVARFDGDVTIERREEALQHFRTSPQCRVLLMTVKTGGVGLNLVEANPVLFLDRNCE